MISERLFTIFAKKKKKILKGEFLEGMINLYSGDSKSISKIIFEIFDFDGDGQISKQDMTVIISLSLATNTNNFEEQIENLKNVQINLDKFFSLENNTQNLINYEQFTFLQRNNNIIISGSVVTDVSNFTSYFAI
jgi:hypothetical protein